MTTKVQNDDQNEINIFIRSNLCWNISGKTVHAIDQFNCARQDHYAHPLSVIQYIGHANAVKVWGIGLILNISLVFELELGLLCLLTEILCRVMVSTSDGVIYSNGTISPIPDIKTMYQRCEKMARQNIDYQRACLIILFNSDHYW